MAVALTLLLRPSLGAGGLNVTSSRVPGGLLVGGIYAALALFLDAAGVLGGLQADDSPQVSVLTLGELADSVSKETAGMAVVMFRIEIK